MLEELNKKSNTELTPIEATVYVYRNPEDTIRQYMIRAGKMTFGIYDEFIDDHQWADTCRHMLSAVNNSMDFYLKFNMPHEEADQAVREQHMPLKEFKYPVVEIII